MKLEPKQTVVEKYSQKAEIEFYSKFAMEHGLSKEEEVIIKKYFKKRGKILDIGCGAGREAFCLAKMGFEVNGIDIIHEMIKSARKNAKELGISVNFSVGDACNLDFVDNFFSYAVALSYVIQYIPKRENRIECLKEAKRVLNPGGILIFSTGNIYSHTAFIVRLIQDLCFLGKLIKKQKDEEFQSKLIGLHDTIRKISGWKHIILWTYLKQYIVLNLRTIKNTAFYFFINAWRKFLLMILGNKYRALEPRDIWHDDVSPVKSHGKVFYHIYPHKEVLQDIEQAGLEIIEYRVFPRWKKDFIPPEIIRRIAPSTFYICQKV